MRATRKEMELPLGGREDKQKKQQREMLKILKWVIFIMFP